MLSLSPALAKRAAIALETVGRAPLTPIHNANTPRNLSALPPSIRALPVDLQVVALCDMLADARLNTGLLSRRDRQIASLQSQFLKVNTQLKEVTKQRDDLLAFFS